ncbi:M23 family metallopeptidase [Algihabitans albus]|uniref:M23 family metallopeptidase n=1 Tax=Algihabitans albus TaxID=2164067 RepID=UPI0013C35C11|nr:M23 family metallopeptidase [Algihabitans albus]
MSPPAPDLDAELAPTAQAMLVSAYHLRLHDELPAQTGEARTTETELKVERGDTLMGLLIGAGAQRTQAYEAIEALSEVFSPRKLRVGQQIAVTFGTPVRAANGANMTLIPAAATETARDGATAQLPLLSIRFRPSVEQDIEVVRDREDTTFVARAIERQLASEPRYAEGEIDSSLFEAALAADVPHDVLVDAMRTFSFDVDFQRDIQKGDSFRLLFDGFRDETGAFVKSGDILFAELVLSGKPVRLYLHTPGSGVTDYFNEEGQSVRKTLLRTPVDGARLSSGFGMRRHPVLGYNRMHKGLDFAAPTGTPIYAAGDGVVEKAARWGAYGNYVRIRHNSTYKTAYAHLSKFGKGVSAGTRVKQGQVIGYVGSTGRSTGPHLHYEVLVEGAQVNPRSIKLPSGEVLKGDELAAFQAERKRVDHLMATLRTAPQIAKGD